MNNKKIKDIRKLKLYSISLIIIILVVLLLVCIVISNNKKEAKETEQLAVSEIITASSDIESTKENTELEEEIKGDVKVEAVDVYKVIQSEIELLKNKDTETIQRYFGESEVFTGEAISDKLTATVATFISQPSSDSVVVHICSLDYTKMRDTSEELKSTMETNNSPEDVGNTVKKEVAKGVIKGQYDIHYNIPVIIKNGKVVVTENFKQAITGNWYKGINTYLESIECPIKTEGIE